MPEDAADGEEPREREPEPVVTATMADLYAKQGLYDEAREVYEKLLAEDPGNVELEAKLNALQGLEVTTGQAVSPAPHGRRASQRYSIAFTGGKSARALLAAIAGATPAESRPSRPKPPPVKQPAMPSGQAGAGGASSFDQFFGDSAKEAEKTEPEASSESDKGGQAEDGSFQNWLRDLKT